MCSTGMSKGVCSTGMSKGVCSTGMSKVGVFNRDE